MCPICQGKMRLDASAPASHWLPAQRALTRSFTGFTRNVPRGSEGVYAFHKKHPYVDSASRGCRFVADSEKDERFHAFHVKQGCVPQRHGAMCVSRTTVARV